MQLRLEHWLSQAGITRPCTVHTLRHTFATCLYEKTGDLRLVQRALGHKSITTTEIYTHVADSKLRRAVQSLSISVQQDDPTSLMGILGDHAKSAAH